MAKPDQVLVLHQGGAERFIIFALRTIIIGAQRFFKSNILITLQIYREEIWIR